MLRPSVIMITQFIFFFFVSFPLKFVVDEKLAGFPGPPQGNELDRSEISRL